MIQLYFASLGCDKNLVDTEHMLGSLDPAVYTVTNDEEAADVIVINTCCFIDDAKEESIRKKCCRKCRKSMRSLEQEVFSEFRRRSSGLWQEKK